VTAYASTFGRVASSRYCSNDQSAHHGDPVDADDFDQSANRGSPGDVSLFRPQQHSGFTNETQRKFDPALFRVEVIGSLRFAFYDGECVCVDIIGTKDDPQMDVDKWFLELVGNFKGLVSL